MPAFISLSTCGNLLQQPSKQLASPEQALKHWGNVLRRKRERKTGKEGAKQTPLDTGKDWKQKEKRAAEDEMVGWHPWLRGHEFEQAQKASGGQGRLACCNYMGLRRVGHGWVTEKQQTNVCSRLESRFSLSPGAEGAHCCSALTKGA